MKFWFNFFQVYNIKRATFFEIYLEIYIKERSFPWFDKSRH